MGHSNPTILSSVRGALPPALPKQTGGCGCSWFIGCLLLILFLAGLAAIVYFFGFSNDRYVGHLDRVVVWAYERNVRPRLAEALGVQLSSEERDRALRTADAGVRKYLQLTPMQKKTILTESAIALWYLRQSEVLPLDRIPHLRKFAEELLEIYERDTEPHPDSHSKPRTLEPIRFQF